MVFLLASLLFSTSLPAIASQAMTLMLPGSDTIQVLFEWHAEQFTKKHPNVDVAILMANAQDQIDKTNTMLAAGTPPDLIWTSNRYSVGWLSTDQFVDLNPLMARDGISAKSFVGPAVLDLQWHGKQAMLPMDVDVNHLFYLPQYVEEAGLSDVNARVDAGEWNYPTFVDYLKRLTKDTNGDGRPDFWGLALGVSPGFVWEPEYAAWIWATGGRILNESKTAELISRPEAVRGLDYMLRLRHEYGVVAESGWNAQVMNGQAAMSSAATFWGKEFASKFRTSATVRPSVDGLPPVHTMLINGIGIFKGTRNLDLAWDFLKQVVSLEGQSKLVEITGRVPGYLPALSVWQKIYSREVAGSERMVTNITQYSRPLPINEYWVNVTTAIQNELKAVWKDNKPVKSSLEAIGQKLTAILQGR